MLTPNILELFKEYFISFKWDSLLCAVPPDEADQVLSEIKEAFKLPELIFAEPIQKYSDRFTVYKTKADQQVGNERLKYWRLRSIIGLDVPVPLSLGTSVS